MKVFISMDIEGVAGVVAGPQTDHTSPEYAEGRALMIEECNAAIAGAFDGGATAVVVADSHGTMRNLLPARLDQRAQLISGTPRPQGMLTGLDGSFDAVMLVGYHARHGQPGILSHTFMGRVIWDLKWGGRSLGEGPTNAALAGHFGVPAVLLTGDDRATAEAEEAIPGIETVTVKWAFNRVSARSLSPEESRRLIREGARRALGRRAEVRPLQLPPEFEVSFIHSGMADLCSLMPGAERTGGASVRYRGKDFFEAFTVMRLMVTLAGTL